jgi:DNA-binding transcriptional LysR family regulator
MEINEIRYFLAVAKVENMHRASEEIGISPSSLSKAIAKLEGELSVKLFRREGRNIRLTEYGRYLKKKGNELLTLENSIRSEIVGEDNSFRYSIAGSEVLLSYFGVEVAKKIKEAYPQVSVNLEAVERNDLITRVRDGEIDLGLTTYQVSDEFDKKILASIEFSTFISKEHPLFKIYKKNKSIHVDDLLKHPFVVPKNNILGKISKSDSTDGWRDDKFPRLISFTSGSLKTMESLVERGEAIAYLPEYFGSESGLEKIAIVGCPYYCKQKVTLFTKNKSRSGWLNSLF